MAFNPFKFQAAPHQRGLSVTRLGVHFYWSGDNNRFDKDNLALGETSGARLRARVEPHLQRQRRNHIEYWDAMTYLSTTPLPGALAKDDEAELAQTLVWMIGQGHLRDKTVGELIDLPLIEHSRTRLEPYGEGLSDPIRGVTPRTGPLPKGGLDYDPAIRKGIHRTVHVDMTALGVDPQKVEWDRLTVQAVLVQIHADLEMFYETGFLRVRRCQRPACGAFFGASRMDARGKFCSAACRVASGREAVRAAGSVRRRPTRTV